MIKRVLLLGAGVGIPAGLAMAGVEMIYGWASPAHTAWDAPMGIWAYIAGLKHFGDPANHIGPIILGIGGHMANAVFVGIVFAAMMSTVRRPNAGPLLGAGFGAGLWALQRYVFLPINTPEDRIYTTSLTSPQWVWWIAHIALGLTAGLAYLWFDKRRVATKPGSAGMPAPRLREAA
jgi:hypothetical protein